MDDREMLVEQAQALTLAYQTELKSRATAILYERVGVPFTGAAAVSFVLWPLFVVYLGSMGVAVAVLLAGGAAVYGVSEFVSQSKGIDAGQFDAKLLSPEDQKTMALKGQQLQKTLMAVEATLKKPEPPLNQNRPHQPEVTVPTQTPTSPSSAPTAAGSASAEAPINRGTLTWKDGEYLVMVGLSGSSKTTTLIQCVPPGLTLYLTLKADDKAPQSWLAYRLRKFADKAFLAQLDDLCDLIEHLVQSGQPHRLIIDEALTILDQSKDALKTLSDKEDRDLCKAVPASFEGLIKLYIRTGRSDGHYLGLVTQSPNGSDLFESAKTMQGLKIVLCAGEASSNGFAFLVPWAQQLYGQWLTPAHYAQLKRIQSGFWHFWLETGELRGAQTQQSSVELHPCPPFEAYTAIKALRTALQQRQSQAEAVNEPLGKLPDLLNTPLTELPWSQIAAHLLQSDGTGLRTNLGTLLGKGLNGGTLWQQYRDGLADWLVTQPQDLQAGLCQKYASCLPAAIAEAKKRQSAAVSS